jgi:hypothetical protein
MNYNHPHQLHIHWHGEMDRTRQEMKRRKIKENDGQIAHALIK